MDYILKFGLVLIISSIEQMRSISSFSVWYDILLCSKKMIEFMLSYLNNGVRKFNDLIVSKTYKGSFFI